MGRGYIIPPTADQIAEYGGRGYGIPGGWTPSLVAVADRIAWWRSDYVDTGAGAITPWENTWSIGTRDLQQAVVANRPTVTNPDPLFGGHSSMGWDGVQQYMTVPADKVSFKPLNDGTGGCGWAVFRPTAAGAAQCIFGTAGAAANVGMQLRYDGTQKAVRLFIMNGAALIVNVTSALNSVPLNQVCRVVYFYSAAGSPQWGVYVNRVLLISGNPVGAPSAANTTFDYTTARDPSGAANWFTGKIAEEGAVRTTGYVALLNSYLASYYP